MRFENIVMIVNEKNYKKLKENDLKLLKIQMYIIVIKRVVICHLTHVADRKYFDFSVFLCKILAQFFIEIINFVVCLFVFGKCFKGGTSINTNVSGLNFSFIAETRSLLSEKMFSK